MYTMLGVSTFFPVVHGIYIYGLEDLNERMSLSYFIGLAVVNFTGAAIYATRIPERWFPKRFDILGNSHQLMHVLVLLGGIIQERGLLRAIEWWSDADRALCKAAVA
jgi:adiponectin receptor